LKSIDVVRSCLEKLQPVETTGPIFHYRTLQATLVGCVEILSLCSFVLSNVHERFNRSQSQSSKKKKNNGVVGSLTEVITTKEKVSITVEVLRELRSALNVSEGALEKLKPVKIEKTLEEYLATLSITPKPAPHETAETAHSVISTADIDVHSIFDESYQLTIKELSALIKDKLKMMHVK